MSPFCWYHIFIFIHKIGGTLLSEQTQLKNGYEPYALSRKIHGLLAHTECFFFFLKKEQCLRGIFLKLAHDF